jgi:hypothetical protein
MKVDQTVMQFRLESATLFCLVLNCLNIAFAGSNFSWGVVYGSETNIQEAQTEINQLDDCHNIETLSVYYLNVVTFM